MSSPAADKVGGLPISDFSNKDFVRLINVLLLRDDPENPPVDAMLKYMRSNPEVMRWAKAALKSSKQKEAGGRNIPWGTLSPYRLSSDIFRFIQTFLYICKAI